MPRYFFDGTDGRELVDKSGAEYSDDFAARQEVILRAMNGTAHQLEHYRGCNSILLRNEKGEQIYKVPIRRISGGDQAK